uniref:type I restriction endonuclease subunit R n=1 Tax=Polynucleobacter sp. TaxID=2029855 RepID=UPI0040475447
MNAHAYSEDQLVEQPAIGLLGSLGWETLIASEEVFGKDGTLSRETRGEVVLTKYLKVALTRLNPTILDPMAVLSAIDEITRDRSAMSLAAANKEIYNLLKEGVPVSIPDTEHGGQKTIRIRVVDWENSENNNFLLVSQFSVTGPLYTCRPDLVGFVNGLPWIVVELKKPGVPARNAFDENLTHYKDQIPSLFWYNALMIASNGSDSRVGSLTADWERWFEWKRIEREDEPRRVSLEVMLRGVCDKGRILDLVENFTLFSEHKAGLVKILGQNHQFIGVNNAIASMLEARELGHGRGGVFWQTQGSGKSYSMVFFAQKILRKLVGNWTFAVVTDRVELDNQIAGTFKAVGAVTQAEGDKCHASSGAELRELLRGNHRYVFTLVQKFQSPDLLCDRSDVIVMTDEAHRSQYDTLALNMRSALPNAMFLAFTGTPLIAGEERTKEVFGDYVSIYDFQQSVEDGATVPLFYENRTPELHLNNPDLNEDLYRLIEEVELDPEQEARLERELSRQYHIITRDDRLEVVARDIVSHFLGRGFLGKAMVVSIDKATALKTFNKVKKSWEQETAKVEEAIKRLQNTTEAGETTPKQAQRDIQLAELRRRLDVLKTTDMAVIVSPSQNEISKMHELGLDIEPHRRRMNDSQPPLDERFKDSKDPLRLVFVCAMWLTGFDAPSCSTVYLDKPMRNHTLMQTISRANRVFPDKHSGMIVDYANVFSSLEKALAIYGAGGGGKTPVKDKQQLVRDLKIAIKAALEFCNTKGVNLERIISLADGSFERLQSIEDAIDSLISPESLRRQLFGHERLVSILYKAIKPDPAALEFFNIVVCLSTLVEAIRVRLNPNPPDISKIMGGISDILDESITGLAIRKEGPAALDLSKINFQALAQKFKESKHKNTDLESLKAAIRTKLEKLIQANKTRADFSEKFEELIESYNTGSRTIEEIFAELLNFTNTLNAEEERHVRENMSEEELVVFDILTRPAPDLTDAEKAEVKKVSRELLAKLKNLLVLNWRQKETARSQLKLAIQDALDDGLPEAYTKDLYQDKCSAMFEHIYEAYPEAERQSI